MKIMSVFLKKLIQQGLFYILILFILNSISFGYSSESITCENELCHSIIENISNQRSPASLPTAPTSSSSEAEPIPVLNTREYLDHASNRFGYGLSSLDRVTPENLQEKLIIALNSIHNDAIKPGSFYSKDLKKLAEGFTFTVELPNQTIQYNPILNSRKELARIQTVIQKVAQNTSDPEEKRRIRREVLKVDTNTARVVAQFRTLISIFGSEYRVYEETSKIKDHQSHFASVLQEFWFNHFNIDYQKVGLDAALGEDGYEAMIHQKMNTTFYQLLKSVTKHTAMLTYLDNQVNRYDIKNNKASNQNLGRELLELHTLGQGPGDGPNALYTQFDVEESAKMLTGLNIKKSGDPEDLDSFFYGTQINPLSHITDYIGKRPHPQQIAPRVLKKRFCLASSQVLDDRSGNEKCPLMELPDNIEDRRQLAEKHIDLYLKVLASHPVTRKNICNKLTSRFIGQKFITQGDRKVEVMRSTVAARCEKSWGELGDLKSMYLSILLSPETFSSDNYLKIGKNPNELVISAIRASGISSSHIDRDILVNFSDNLLTEIRKLGLPYRNWMTPTGYPNSKWNSKGLLVRWTKSSFSLASILESISDKKTTPLMGIKPDRGLAGSYEERATQILNGEGRLNFVHDILGLGRLLENDYVRKFQTPSYIKGIEILNPTNSFLLKQKIGSNTYPVPVKTGLVIEISNGIFMKK